MLVQLGALAGMGPSSFGVRNPNDLYVGMIKSRSVADALIEKFNLRQLYGKDNLIDTRERLQKATRVSSGRDGIISIDVDDRDPKRAASLANAYVEELEKLNERLAVTEAGQRRLFFERQLKETKAALAAADLELKSTQEKTGLIKLDDQGRAIIGAVAELRAQIAAKEVLIDGMRTFATEGNPELLRARQELGGMRAQLRKMETSAGGAEGGALVSTGRVPAAGLELVRKYRDVKYYETVYELLARQYEIARLDEAKDNSMIQVLDAAVPPEKRSKPRVLLATVLATIVSFLLSAVLVVSLQGLQRVNGTQDGAAKLRELQQLFRDW
jgi:uncharacterized protein involved in exopolysaccharide biosynthesis